MQRSGCVQSREILGLKFRPVTRPRLQDFSLAFCLPKAAPLAVHPLRGRHRTFFWKIGFRPAMLALS
jgi:hypothetical protein